MTHSCHCWTNAAGLNFILWAGIWWGFGFPAVSALCVGSAMVCLAPAVAPVLKRHALAAIPAVEPVEYAL